MSQPTTLDLSVVIVTYRTREIVRDCLCSLFGGAMAGLEAEVILVDNHSADGTVEMVRRDFPQVRLLASAENLGFSRANNLGIAEARGRLVLLLNPDTLIPPDAITRCVRFLECQPETVGALSCRVESPDGTLQRDCSRRFVTPWSECCRALLLDRLFSRVDFFNREPMVGWDRQDTRPVEAVLGAFMLIRRQALERIGGLDERFFLMYEDMDWCKRAALAGYQILFWPGERIIHLGGSSWRQEKVATYASTQRSALQYIEKHHPRSLPLVRATLQVGMALKLALLRLNLLRRPGDPYTLEHLAMARAANRELQTGRRKESVPPSLLYVSTLDRIIAVMFPHLEAARAAGWRVEVACQPTVYGEDLEKYADQVHLLPMKRFPLHPANLLALRKLIRLIRNRGYTVVHCHNPTGGIVGRLAASLARDRTGFPLRVYTAHGFHFHRHGGRLSNLIYRAAETIAGRFWSDAVLTITREDYDAALQGGVVPADRLFLTGGVGVSALEEFHSATVSKPERMALRQELGVSDDTVPLLLLIGEFIPRKRHADAIAALPRILAKYPGARLVLPGDGLLRERLEAQAQALGVAEAVLFPGYRRDIARLLAASDLFLFPSQQEGLPCAVQEALSMEVPVVATDVRGNADLVDDSCGRLVPLGDVEMLAEKALELLALTGQERRELGRAGRQKMLERYERSACVQQWQDVYRLLLSRQGKEL